MARILIVGGYGAFGSRAGELLARDAGLELVIAGRNEARAKEAAARLSATAAATVGHATLDAACMDAADLRALAPSVVINASGPFQSDGYVLARAAIGAGCHYVDLADSRAFVTGIVALDTAARAAGVEVVSGASSVPGLSSAVAAAYAPELARLESIEIAISPGNSFDPGSATVASILAGLGRPIEALEGGARRTLHGWQGLRRKTFPGLGRRWLADVDVPDLALLPEHYPELETVRFGAGLEVAGFHLGLWGLAGLARARLIGDPRRLAGPLLAVKRRLSFLGSDRGGMTVDLTGKGAEGRECQISWHLIAGSGHGPYVPAIPAAIVARRLARNESVEPGARACFGLFTPEEFVAEARGLDIVTGLRRSSRNAASRGAGAGI